PRDQPSPPEERQVIIPVVVAGLVGFLAAGRTQPQTRCEKKVVLGSRTGRTYQVEEFPQAGFLVVRAPDGYGVFQHATATKPRAPRFSWRGGEGASETLHGMCTALGIVKEPAESPPPAASHPEPSSRPRPTVVPTPSQKTGS